MAEKKYVIDNAKLMAEWNWEKNNKLNPIFTIIILKTLLNRLISKANTAKARYNSIAGKINYSFTENWFSLFLILNAIFIKLLLLINIFFCKLS